LRRLVDKGHLTARPVGNSHLYEPAGSALKSLLAAADNLLNNMLEGTSGLVITHMLEKSRLSEDELAKLRKLIDERTGKPSADDKTPL
jgi:BlaI family penicillinase repressor